MATQSTGVALQRRLADLEEALAAGEGRWDQNDVKQVREVLDRIEERQRLGADRTIVAFVGATGSGKSSLFNALTGMELAEVGVRRPTTGQASACVWSAEGADPLLDWLGVPPQLRTNRESVLDGSRHHDLRGLVLLDLPDHDSVQVGHRLEVERLVELVDLIVWVVDPQKYADEVLHAYLRGMAGHQDVVLVALNHVDRLNPEEVSTCSADLRRLLDAEGLRAVSLITTSAVSGLGIRALRTTVSDLVAQRGAFVGRALADLEAAAARLRQGLGPTEADPNQLPGSDQLVSALADAAGLPVMLDAVATEYRQRALARTDWLPLRAWRRLRPDPLTKLDLSAGDAAQVRQLSSVRLPAASPAQRDRVQLAVRQVTDAAAQGLPPAWSEAVHQAAVAGSDELSEELDDAVRRVKLPLERPAWWCVANLVQVLAALTALGGLIAWVLSAAFGTGSGAPVPVLALVGGLTLGALFALATRWFIKVGAQRRRARLAVELRTVVSELALDEVVSPIAAVLREHRLAREALGPSRGARYQRP